MHVCLQSCGSHVCLRAWDVCLVVPQQTRNACVCAKVSAAVAFVGSRACTWPGTAEISQPRGGIRTFVSRPLVWGQLQVSMYACASSQAPQAFMCQQASLKTRVCLGVVRPVNATARGSVPWSVCLPSLGTGVRHGVGQSWSSWRPRAQDTDVQVVT